MDGRNCKTRKRSTTQGTLILNVSRVTLNYLQDADRVRLTLKHPDRPAVRNLVLELGNMEKTARADDSMELSAKVGLPETNGKMRAPKKITFCNGGSSVSFMVENVGHAGFTAKPMSEGPVMA